MVKVLVISLVLEVVFGSGCNGNSENANCCDYKCNACQNGPWECESGKCKSGIQVGNICLENCPYGFEPSCTFASGVVLEETFSSFELTHFQAGSNASTYFPFNNGESDDPLPMKQRGLFVNFDRFIKSKDEVNLHHTFTITMWLRAESSGVLLKKWNHLVIDAGGADPGDGMTVELEDPAGNVAHRVLTFNLNPNQWYYAAFTSEFSSASGTTLEMYISGNRSPTESFEREIFRHPPGHPIQIGGFSCSAFVYKIRILQEVDVSVIEDDEICGDSFSGGCLWNCDEDQYWDGSKCESCDSSCSYGCLRATDCNLCDDRLCAKCSDFSTCQVCIENASNTASCECNEGYTWNPDSGTCGSQAEPKEPSQEPTGEEGTSQEPTGEEETSQEPTSETEEDTGEATSQEPPKDISESSQEAETLGQGTAAGVAVAGIGISVLSSNPSGFWLMLNTLQLLTYIPLSNNPLTPGLKGFFKGLNLAINVPSVFDTLIEESESPNTEKQSNEYGFKSKFFLINAGLTVMIFCFLLVMWPFIWMFSECKVAWIQKLCNSLLEKFKFSLFIRLWIQRYLDIAIPCFIQLSSFSSIKRIVVNNIIAAMTAGVLLLTTPISIATFFHRIKDQLESISEESPTYKEYGTLFYELKYKNEFKACFTYVFFTMQRLLFSVSLVFLGNYPYLQASVNCGVMFVFAGFVIVVRPYKDKTMQVVSIFVEFWTFMIFLAVIYFLKSGSKDHEELVETAIMFTAFGVTCLRMLGMLINLGVKVHECWKRKKTAQVQQEPTVFETNNQQTTEHTPNWILSSDYPIFVRPKNQDQLEEHEDLN